MRFTIFNFLKFGYKRNETIVYRLINYVRATLQSNIKDVINLIYQSLFKSVMLTFSLFKKC